MRRFGAAALLICFLCALLAALPPVTARADFGDYSGDTDYGDSGWGDSGSDYDYGSDSGYGSGSGGSYYGYQSYDTYGSTGDSGGESTPGEMFLGILFLAAVVLLWLWLLGRRKKRQEERTAMRNAGAQRTPDSRLTPMEEYTRLDPGFDAAALTEKLSNLYVQMQNCWTARDIEPVRPFFTDALWSQMDRQLDLLRRGGRTNYVERIAVLGVALRGYYQAGGEDHLVAEVRARIVDYTLEDQSGKLLSGDRGREKFMTYEWELTRPGGQTTAAGDGVRTVNCPNCGAPLSLNVSARCPYCGSLVELHEHDWAICAIRGLAQRTGR